MKAFRFLLVLMIIVLAIGIAPTDASAGVFSYSSGIRVLNLSSSPASVTLMFYNLNGGLNTTVSQAIAGNGYYSFFPLTGVSSGFNGSVIVSSNTEIAATSNILGYIGSTNVAGGSYTAAKSGSTSVYMPTLMKGNSGYNTWFNVQNAGDAATDVTVTYADGTSNTGTIQPGSAIKFDQATETHSLNVFAGKVTSDDSQPLVVSVVEENPYIIFAYNGFSSGALFPVMPLINENNSGWRTGMQIQNIGTVNTTVTVAYTPRAVGGAGTACTETHLIEAGKGTQFAFKAFEGPFGASPISGSTCVRGEKFIGNAKVTVNSGNQPLVAIVNQLLSSPTQAKGGAYNSFDTSLATNRVVLPLIMDRNSGWYTGFNIQNVGTSATNVSCTFSPATSYTISGSVDPGATLGGTQVNQIANGYVGSGICTATGGDAKIVGMVNQLRTTGATDFFMVYNAINQVAP